MLKKILANSAEKGTEGAAQPPPYNLLELAFHTKVVHGVDVGNFPAILHSGPLPLLSYGGNTPLLTNKKLIRTETVKVTATAEGGNVPKAQEKTAAEAEKKAAEAEA